MGVLLTTILSYLLLYKYIAIFFISYLAALVLPLPSTTSLLAASAFASQGYLNVYLIGLIALTANVLGDITGFILVRWYGEKILVSIGLKKVITSAKYIRLKQFVVNNSGRTIFFSRFVSGVGPLVNILTGLSENISFKRYLVYEIPGQFTYVSGLVISGYFLGGVWEMISSSFGYLAVIIFFVVIIVYTMNVYKKRKSTSSTTM